MRLLKNVVASAGDYGRVFRATGYSMAGFRSALRKEAAFRQEVFLFVFLGPLGAWLGRSGVERALLIGSLLLVMVVELLNSSVEATVDRISRKHHKLSGRAKDLGSAAVTLSLVLAALVWALLLADRYSFPGAATAAALLNSPGHP
jgi:diacylglycerol kinase (ATP)